MAFLGRMTTLTAVSTAAVALASGAMAGSISVTFTVQGDGNIADNNGIWDNFNSPLVTLKYQPGNDEAPCEFSNVDLSFPYLAQLNWKDLTPNDDPPADNPNPLQLDFWIGKGSPGDATLLAQVKNLKVDETYGDPTGGPDKVFYNVKGVVVDGPSGGSSPGGNWFAKGTGTEGIPNDTCATDSFGPLDPPLWCTAEMPNYEEGLPKTIVAQDCFADLWNQVFSNGSFAISGTTSEQIVGGAASNTRTVTVTWDDGGSGVICQLLQCAGEKTKDTMTIDPKFDGCQIAGNLIYVNVNMSTPTSPVVGAQFFLNYENDIIEFVGIEPGPLFDEFLFEQSPGSITYLVGINPKVTDPILTDETLATICFKVGDNSWCNLPDLVYFKAQNDPPNQFTDVLGDKLIPNLFNLPPVKIDNEAPTIVAPENIGADCISNIPPKATNVNQFLNQPGGQLSDNCSDDLATLKTQLLITSVDTILEGSYEVPCPLVIERVYTAIDKCGNQATDTQIIKIDDEQQPSFENIPGNLFNNYSDRNECGAWVAWPTVILIDNCPAETVVTATATDGQTVIDIIRNGNCFCPVGFGQDGQFFTPGTWTVTYTATDDCNPTWSQSFLVEVLPSQRVTATVEIDTPTVAEGYVRCVQFRFCEQNTGQIVVVNRNITFTGGATAIGTIDNQDPIIIPCGVWKCVTVQDPRHTLRRALVDFDGITKLPVDPKNPDEAAYDLSATGSNSLIPGNINGYVNENNDCFVSIGDFGAFVGQLGKKYGTGDTPCPFNGVFGPPANADFNGDGVVSAADFQPIYENFLTECDTCPCDFVPLADASDPQSELRRISVKKLAEQLNDKSAAMAADLNQDGWVDWLDISAFAGGARP